MSRITSLLVNPLVSLLWLAMPAFAQNASQPNEGSCVTYDATNNVFTLNWWGRSGQSYFIQHSEDLLAWNYYPLIVVGKDALASMNFQTTAPNYFLRLEIEADPFNTDSDGDGIPNGWEVLHGLNPHDPADANLDADGDGWTNKQEYLTGGDPQDASSGPSFPAVQVVGNGGQGERIARQATVTLPAGSQSYIVVVAVKTDEYPNWTSIESEYNDLVDWNISPAGGTPIQGSTTVNTLHSAFAQSEQNGTSFIGLTPYATAVTGVVQANPTSATEVQIEVGATNVSDSALPTTVIAALLPVDITITIPGDFEPPTGGVTVVKGGTLRISLNDSSQPPINTSPGQPVWKSRQLKSDGTYTDWQTMGPNCTGDHFYYSATKSGIFQVKAVFSGDDANAVKYVRKKDELRTSNGPMGPGVKGQADSFGVCDTQIQKDIRGTTRSYLGSTAFASDLSIPADYGFSAYPASATAIRCNIFVAHRCCAVGATVPAINGITGSYPPLANQWAGLESTSRFYFTTTIDSWPILSAETFPQPGFIIAHPVQGDAGHCAIIDYDGGGIGAGVSGTVNKNYDFYDGTSRFRKYQPSY